MRVGLISDIHGNRVALEAVLDDMPAVDRLVCAGDVVGYNPWPADCVDAMRERGVPTVVGNHDAAVVSGTAFRFNEMAKAGVEYARRELDDEQMGWLEALPEKRLLCEDRVKVVHGHPDDPDRYTYPADFSARLLEQVDVLVLGHTHVQHAEKYGQGVVVNPGSVGQPRDSDPKAAYAVLDLGSLEIDLRRVGYDVEAVQRKIREEGLPERLGTRLARGK